jgi:hypothetical protein
MITLEVYTVNYYCAVTTGAYNNNNQIKYLHGGLI